MGNTKNLIAKLSLNTLYLSIISSIGFGLSLYTLYVEVKFENDHNYTALCDINEVISCTKVFSTKYGQSFGLFSKDSPLSLPNPIYGLVFYLVQLILSNVVHTNVFVAKLHLINSGIVNLVSLYLAYILFYVLKQICLVCISTYFVNLLMLYFSYSRLSILFNSKTLKRE